MKIISLNTERDKHNKLVFDFLKKENADVVCLQEVFYKDFLVLQDLLGIKSAFFKPRLRIIHDKNEKGFEGIAILSKYKANFFYRYIFGNENDLPLFPEPHSTKEKRDSVPTILIWSEIETANDIFKIVNMHGPWTEDGQTTAYQMDEFNSIFSILDQKIKNFVLVGDLNAPRGRDAFDFLASKYKDNVPKEIESSIDPVLHRVKGLKRMVDGIFSTSEYNVTDVRMVEGVSDHKAVVANIEKVKQL